MLSSAAAAAETLKVSQNQFFKKVEVISVSILVDQFVARKCAEAFNVFIKSVFKKVEVISVSTSADQFVATKCSSFLSHRR